MLIKTRRVLMRANRSLTLARSDGLGAVGHRLCELAMHSFNYPSITTEVPPDELLGASATAMPVPVPGPGPDRIRVGWVVPPPTVGSGGLTTILRVVRQLEARGHQNTLYIHDRRGSGDLGLHRRVLNQHFPQVRAAVRDARGPIAPCDVLMATAWSTAYRVRSADVCAHRAYFVQDYEPWFYAAGTDAELARATYRFGLHGITAGPWLAQRLHDEFGMTCDSFDLGADERYFPAASGTPRDGISFYARPRTPRRGFELGVMALAAVAERHPELTIHLFGDRIRRRLPFPYVDHGFLSVEELNRLYNRCRVGLVLSMSNLSLLPLEFLAAGCVPLVNDAPHTRGVLDHESIQWAEPTPLALAEAMSAVVRHPSLQTPESAAAFARSRTWAEAGDAVESSLFRIVRHGRRVTPSLSPDEERAVVSSIPARLGAQ